MYFAFKADRKIPSLITPIPSVVFFLFTICHNSFAHKFAHSDLAILRARFIYIVRIFQLLDLIFSAQSIIVETKIFAVTEMERKLSNVGVWTV